MGRRAPQTRSFAGVGLETSNLAAMQAPPTTSGSRSGLNVMQMLCSANSTDAPRKIETPDQLRKALGLW